MESFSDFLVWENTSRDTIDFKRTYADVAGDLMAGLVLSEIVFWHLPNKNGGGKLKVSHDGALWIACPRSAWWERVRMTPRQIDLALGLLVAAGIVVKKIYKYDNVRTTHVRVNEPVFLERLRAVMTGDADQFYKTVKRASKAAKTPVETPEPDVEETLETAPEIPTKSLNSDLELTNQGFPLTETTTETKNLVGIADGAAIAKPGSYQARTGMTDAECESQRAQVEAEVTAKRILQFERNTHEAGLYPVLIELWQIGGGVNGEAGQYVRMLRGKAKSGRRKRGQAPDVFDMQAALFEAMPVTPDELRNFAAHYRKTTLGGDPDKTLVKDPVKLAGALDAWRQTRDARAAQGPDRGSLGWFKVAE